MAIVGRQPAGRRCSIAIAGCAAVGGTGGRNTSPQPRGLNLGKIEALGYLRQIVARQFVASLVVSSFVMMLVIKTMEGTIAAISKADEWHAVVPAALCRAAFCRATICRIYNPPILDKLSASSAHPSCGRIVKDVQLLPCAHGSMRKQWAPCKSCLPGTSLRDHSGGVYEPKKTHA